MAVFFFFLENDQKWGANVHREEEKRDFFRLLAPCPSSLLDATTRFKKETKMVEKGKMARRQDTRRQ